MLDELLLVESHGLQRVAHYEYLLMLIMQHQRPQVKEILAKVLKSIEADSILCVIAIVLALRDRNH